MLAACSASKRLSTALSYLGSTAAVLSSPQNLRQTAKMMAIRCLSAQSIRRPLSIKKIGDAIRTSKPAGRAKLHRASAIPPSELPYSYGGR